MPDMKKLEDNANLLQVIQEEADELDQKINGKSSGVFSRGSRVSAMKFDADARDSKMSQKQRQIFEKQLNKLKEDKEYRANSAALEKQKAEVREQMQKVQ